MTLATAFLLAVLTGVIAGAVVAKLRKMVYGGREFPTFQAAFLGGLGAGAIFGAVVVFNAVLYFLAGPASPAGMLAFTIFSVVLLALPFLLL